MKTMMMMMMMNNQQSHSWGNNRPFNAYSNYLKQKFGGRIQKISLNGGFTCPNRDGTVGVGGCAFCNNDAFITSYCVASNGITQQIIDGKLFVKRRYRRANTYFAYFQAYSNTYTSLENLKKLFNEVLQFPEIIGFIIGTRPDCIDNEKLEFFAELSKKYYVVLEYGIESIYDKTLLEINRGHTYATSKEAIIKTASYGIHVGAHLILGLPGESREQILLEAKEISTLPLHSIKLHQLQIVKDTQFAKEYSQNPEKFNLFTPQEYIPFVAEFISNMSPHIIIERFASESPIRVRIAPIWEGIKYESFVAMLEEYMLEHNLWQGKNFKK